MPEGKIRAIDIEAALFAGCFAIGGTDGGKILVRGGGIGCCVRPGCLPGEVRPENKGIEAVDLLFQVEKDTLVPGPGIAP